MYVCMYVCLKLNNSGTAGPIWLSLFLLAPSWSRDGFRLKNPDPGSGFSENPEKPISRQNRFFRIFGKTGPRIWNFFSLKPSRDQDGADKKRLSQIGPAVPEL